MSSPVDVGADAAARLTRRLTVLGSVSVVGGLLTARPGAGEQARAFGVQTALWGGVDLAIVAVGALRGGPPPTARRLRTVLLVNAGLDVGYVATGAVLVRRRPDLGGRLSPAAASGHGWAVVLQGLALLALDLYAVRAVTVRRRPGALLR